MGKKIDRKQLIKKYLDFFKKKDHNIIPNAPLVPVNDPTVLFTTAGMHPLVPYLLGQKHPLGKRLANVQKCIRTTDIDEVGDATHHTFFEMLGNWSLGDYWKEEAIKMSFEFLTSKKWLGLSKDKLAITFFSGDKDFGVEADFESKKEWVNLKIPSGRIINLGKEDNWWGPAGETGPCGPDTEMFYWASKNKVPKEFNPNESTLATGEHGWVEIWNDVFMEYNKTKNGTFKPLKQKNIDTGMGVERTVAILNGLDDNYMAGMWKPIIEKIEGLSEKKYEGNEKAMRIIADHIKASVFIIAEGISPSNTGRGYVLRRLIRRAVRYGRQLDLKNFTDKIAEPVFKIYNDYKELKNKREILKTMAEEEERFNKTLEKGMAVLEKKLDSLKISDLFPGKTAFLLYQSYGFPIEITKEILFSKGFDVDMKAFEKEFEKHQKLSKTAAKGKFSSGLADHSKQATKLHTATHLLNQALKEVLNKDVKQRGSNITPKRLRFDFNFPRKLTDEEIKKIEKLVNKKIKESLPVKREEMSLKKALASGAEAEFGAKYPDKVSVYSIGKGKKPFSKEICTGPHVKNTREIGRFKIIKEQSSAAGVRRIKAVVE